MAETTTPTCPACSAPLPAGAGRCPYCGTDCFAVEVTNPVPESPPVEDGPPPTAEPQAAPLSPPSAAGCLSLILGLCAGLLGLAYVLIDPPGNKLSLIFSAPATLVLLLPGIGNRFPGARWAAWILAGLLFIFIGIWVFWEVTVWPAILVFVGLGVYFVLVGFSFLGGSRKR